MVAVVAVIAFAALRVVPVIVSLPSPASMVKDVNVEPVTVVVSSPSPMPAPKGEVPRVAGKTKTVPAKDWSKTPVQAEKHGLGGVAPAKKDWAKTGASKQPVSQPKDWGKKAERSGAAKKPPAPRRDLDRSR